MRSSWLRMSEVKSCLRTSSSRSSRAPLVGRRHAPHELPAGERRDLVHVSAIDPQLGHALEVAARRDRARVHRLESHVCGRVESRVTRVTAGREFPSHPPPPTWCRGDTMRWRHPARAIDRLEAAACPDPLAATECGRLPPHAPWMTRSAVGSCGPAHSSCSRLPCALGFAMWACPSVLNALTTVAPGRAFAKTSPADANEPPFAAVARRKPVAPKVPGFVASIMSLPVTGPSALAVSMIAPSVVGDGTAMMITDASLTASWSPAALTVPPCAACALIFSTASIALAAFGSRDATMRWWPAWTRPDRAATRAGPCVPQITTVRSQPDHTCGGRYRATTGPCVDHASRAQPCGKIAPAAVLRTHGALASSLRCPFHR